MTKTSEELWLEALEANGHSPVLNEDGELDIFAYSDDYHNGPRCSSCCQVWCKHCTPPVAISYCDGGTGHLASLKLQLEKLSAEIKAFEEKLRTRD